MKLPSTFLVDTNIPIVSSAALRPQSDDPSPECIRACVELIEAVCLHGGLVVDEGSEIVTEYRHNLSQSGQPGLGDRFMKWVHDNQYNEKLVTRIPITKDGETYKEFPSHPDLKNFDIADRKFIAVANAHEARPAIYQATDSKWWILREALKKAGVNVRFLCPDYVKAKSS